MRLDTRQRSPSTIVELKSNFHFQLTTIRSIQQVLRTLMQCIKSYLTIMGNYDPYTAWPYTFCWR